MRILSGFCSGTWSSTQVPLSLKVATAHLNHPKRDVRVGISSISDGGRHNYPDAPLETFWHAHVPLIGALIKNLFGPLLGDATLLGSAVLKNAPHWMRAHESLDPLTSPYLMIAVAIAASYWDL